MIPRALDALSPDQLTGCVVTVVPCAPDVRSGRRGPDLPSLVDGPDRRRA